MSRSWASPLREAVEQLSAQPRTRSRPRNQGTVFVRCPYELTDYFGPIVSSVGDTLRLILPPESTPPRSRRCGRPAPRSW